MASKIAKQYDVSGCTTVDMVLDASGTAWEPKLATPYFGIEGEDVKPDLTSKAIVNPSNGRVLGYVGDRYRANSHVGQIQLLSDMVSNGTLTPANVSVWDGGKVIAYQFRAPSLDMVISGRDVVSPLFTLAFWHDGMGSDRSFFADFRWFCKNQMGMVNKLTSGTNVRHMGENRIRYQELVEGRIRELSTSLGDRYQTMRRMLDKDISTTEQVYYLARCAGVTDDIYQVTSAVLEKESTKLRGNETTVYDMLQSLRKDDCGAPGTVWQAFNGVTRYVTHDYGRNEATRAARALLGPGQDMTSRAFQLAGEMVQVAA